MFLSKGEPTEAVDVMQYCWMGQWPKSRAPSIRNISLENIGWKKDHILTPNTKVNLNVEYLKYNNKKVILEFALFPEAFSNKIGGDIQLSPDPLKLNIIAQAIPRSPL